MREKPFTIAIKRSKWLLIYLSAIHIMMIVTLVCLIGNTGFTLIAVLVISASFVFYCRRYQWLKSARAIIGAGYHDIDNWQLIYSDGTSKNKLNLKHCLVTPQWVILNFFGTRFWKTESVIIVADSVDRELFRQLRVYLRDPKTFQQ